MTQFVTASLVALVIGLVVLAGWGLGRVARRAGLTSERSTWLTSRVLAVVCLWLGLTALLAASGVLAVWTSRPPRVLFLPVTAFAVLMIVTRTRTFRSLLPGLPRAWPVALQSFRIGVELILWGLYVTHQVPVQITFEGRNFDVLIGASAPLVAWLVATGRLRRGPLLAWHGLGLALLANVVGTAATSIPGPLHLDWPGEPLTAIASWPMVWIPAFLAPFAVFLHVVSIRQTLAAPGAALRSLR